MSLLNSLLDAIIRLGGDALVMHVGERPYVVTTSLALDAFRGPLSWGQVELSSRPLTAEAVLAMLGQMLPADVQSTLDEVGAIEHEIDSPDGQHRFVVVAARGGDDVWVEVRVKHDPPPQVAEEPAPAAAPEPVVAPPMAAAAAPEPVAAAEPVPIEPLPAVAEAEVHAVDPGAREAAVAEALAAREAEIRAEAEAAQESRLAELRSELTAREAEFHAQLAAHQSELQVLLAAREAEIRAEAEVTQESRLAVVRSEMAARESELQAALDARAAEFQAAVADAREAAARASAAEAAARAEAATAVAVRETREAELRGESSAALQALEAQFRASMAARESELLATLDMREAAARAEAAAAAEAREAELRATLDARTAEIQAQAGMVVEAREAELRAALTARETELRAYAHAAEVREAELHALAQASQAREAELRAATDAAELRAAELRAQAQAREAGLLAHAQAREAEAAAQAQARETELRALIEAADEQAVEARAALERREIELRAETAAILQAREADLRAEEAAAFAARDSVTEDVARLAAAQVELQSSLAAREEDLRAEMAAVLASRDAEFADRLASALSQREQELIADNAAAIGHREQALAAEFAAERSRLEQELTARAAELSNMADRVSQIEAAFNARMEEAEARAAERESALNAAFEARLADAVAEADERVQAFAATVELEDEARAAAEAVALDALEAVALEQEVTRAALEAQVQAERVVEPSAVALEAAAPPADLEVAAPRADVDRRSEPGIEPADDTRPFLLLPRHVAPGHSSTGVLLDVLRDGLDRGASAVYAIGGSRPLLRIEGEITSPSSLPILHAADIDRFAFEFAPRDEVAHSTSEWTTMVPEVGRVRCVSFEDAAGRGLVFHLAANVSSADELGLSREIQALCNEPDGLVVLAGPRASGKSTLLSAFVDRINRSRSDHVITIESRVRTLHERRHSLISQREVDGEGSAVARAARAALREGPDVLVMDDARSPEAIVVAVDAARAGRLVFLSMPAPSTNAAIERLTDAFSVDRRPQVRALLSGALRAVISQVLVNRVDGGRIAAREVLLSSPQVKQLILEGAFAQVPVAIEGGRRLGMSTLTDSLVSLVRDKSVAPAEALRHAPNRRVMIAALRQEGIDVSEFERRA